MNLLRIHAAASGRTEPCQWAVLDAHGNVVAGAGPLAAVPRDVDRIELILPAALVLITRAQLPPSNRRRPAALLAYAVEDSLASEPELNQVSWLGPAAAGDVLAVVDRKALQAWRDALAGLGIHDYAVHCETLLLPRQDGEWSLAWDGREGFVRTGAFEGAATDCGDEQTPPLALRLLLDDASARQQAPAFIAVHPIGHAAAPDLAAWQRNLGVEIRQAARWDWRTAPPTGLGLVQARARWQLPAHTLTRLRRVGVIVALAAVFHSIALVADWAQLANERRSLQQQMTAEFRRAFPEAVAVADPLLQMRRKLAEARHVANRPDDGDFPVMLAKVATALQDLPPTGLRQLSYESGRITLELPATQDALVHRLAARLLAAGLTAQIAPAGAGRNTLILTLRPS